jgi:hypothetical protein
MLHREVLQPLVREEWAISAMIRFVTDTLQHIDWDEAAEVFERAPLGRKRRDPGKLKRAFESSYAAVYVFEAHPTSAYFVR